MDKLPIGEVIFKLRKEKGVTQDQLAKFIGVSTAAVSKWESKISYPDITLLPVLATFFNVSIDKLLNFKIELSDEEVIKIYEECEALFSSGNLDTAKEKSKSYILKYPSSYYLKLRMAFLFIMYSWKSLQEEKCKKIICYAIELLEDVAQNCSKEEYVEQALFQLGAYYPSIGEEDKAIEALNKIHKSVYDPNDILPSIYIQKKEFKKARELLQGKLYKSIFDISNACMVLANSYMKDEKDINMVEKYCNLSLNIKKTLLNHERSVLNLSMEYLHFAEAYLKFSETDKAITMLNKMLEDMKYNDINNPENICKLWCFNELPQRGKKTITMNLYENIFKIFEEPVFDSIREREDFTGIMKELKKLENRSLTRET